MTQVDNVLVNSKLEKQEKSHIFLSFLITRWGQNHLEMLFFGLSACQNIEIDTLLGSSVSYVLLLHNT